MRHSTPRDGRGRLAATVADRERRAVQDGEPRNAGEPPAGGELRRRPYRKPEAVERGQIKPSLLGSPPPPP